LLTEEPWQGAVSVNLGQRLVVVLTNNGLGGWTAPRIEGSAVGLLGSSGSYDYRCQQSPAFAGFAVLQAQQLGTAILTSYTDPPVSTSRTGRAARCRRSNGRAP
jgi:hypothetical protein